MINELSSILITAIRSTVGTGGLAGIFLFRHNKKMRRLEAQLKEVELSKARIESKTDEWHIWQEQNNQLSSANERLNAANEQLVARNQKLVEMNAEKEDRHQQDLRDKEDRFAKQTDFLRGVQRELIAALEREKAHIRREAQLERQRDHFFNWRCFREEGTGEHDCLRRRPKQPVPIRYVPLSDEDELEAATAPAILLDKTNPDTQQ